MFGMNIEVEGLLAVNAMALLLFSLLCLSALY